MARHAGLARMRSRPPGFPSSPRDLAAPPVGTETAMSRCKTISHHLHRVERVVFNVLRTAGWVVLACLLVGLATGA